MSSQTVGRKSWQPIRTKGDDPRSLKRKRGVDELSSLKTAVEKLDLKEDFSEFSKLPLSEFTKKGLKASHFTQLTKIQSKAIPLALKARDILGAAKTGSGKTLAFLIPVLENLYRQQWSSDHGLGALIISPTRELAAQIFQVLRRVGRYHAFSAGLVIGGKDTQEEQERLARMNILVCTPGRMLQHLDQTAAFDVGNLEMLVLDEADRIMDMGFQSSVDAIIEHLPKSRQTMLFSATQTQKVSYLARLSLRDQEYVGVHEDAFSATPESLLQHYLVCPLPEKLNTLYGFIKSSLKSKIVVFFSSGKQVRFMYESFRHLQPGIPLMHLLGNQKLSVRLATTAKFSASKNACIFATDVVARGLDFPAVDWVVQYDAPEDSETYIHRVGRTARYGKTGRAILMLDPSEEAGVLKSLEQKKVPIENIKVKQGQNLHDISNQLQNMCFQDPELKYLGQKAFASYARSVYLQKDKSVFDINNYDLEGYAASLGLPGTPNIKFQKGDDAKKLKNAPRAALSGDEDSEVDEDAKKPKLKEVRTKYDRMFERRNNDVLSGHFAKMVTKDGDANSFADADEDEGFLSIKRTIAVDEDDDGDNTAIIPEGVKIIKSAGGEDFIVDSKRREKLMTSKKLALKLKGNATKLVFDEDGVAHQMYELEDEKDFQRRGPALEQRNKFVEDEAEKIKQADIADKQTEKQKKREKKEKRKEKVKAALLADSGDAQDADADSKAAAESLTFLASLPIAGEVEESDDERPTKRAKKWFEDESDGEGVEVGANVIEAAEEPETVEDLEALAAGLLE
ncbi:P-loop containing nucleoside triphosphate hydrolase protein [Calycina marina]|uniref:ATP-dependent RNA helicase n=1 Tax=Calycina marina TaxID=1763456 RepID=A0A9P7Z6X2_9HELO|nr:P-loop containing nucleoside triphosphate hydrolase protein [Calycina marina]